MFLTNLREDIPKKLNIALYQKIKHNVISSKDKEWIGNQGHRKFANLYVLRTVQIVQLINIENAFLFAKLRQLNY